MALYTWSLLTSNAVPAFVPSTGVLGVGFNPGAEVVPREPKVLLQTAAALADTGDVLLYGREVASRATGENFPELRK